jgi:Zn finger protein HypA/HybF involved in hydrogenase expression
MKSEPGPPPATLGSSAIARARLIVWCRDCQHQVEPNPADQAERYGAEMTLPDWQARLVCSKCGGREIDMVVTGSKR